MGIAVIRHSNKLTRNLITHSVRTEVESCARNREEIRITMDFVRVQ